MTPVVTTLLTAAAAFFGSWAAARFALSRFYRERIWERRATAYTAIFEALHDIEEWLKQMILLVSKDEETREFNYATFSDAQASLARRAAAETWLLSDDFRSAVERYTDKRFGDGAEAAKDLLIQMAVNVRSAVAELRAIARSDLLVK